MSHNLLTVRAGIAALLTIAWALALMFEPPKYPFVSTSHPGCVQFTILASQ